MQKEFMELRGIRRSGEKAHTDRFGYICEKLPDIDSKLIKKILERDDEYYNIQTHAFSGHVCT